MTACHRSGLRVVTRRPRAHPLRRGQGRHRPAHPGRRRPGRAVRDPGQLHRPGDHPDRTQPRQIPAAQQDAWAEFHPLKRLGTPADVAAAAAFLASDAAFLASDAAAWITGVVLDIAGGTVMT